MRFIPLGPGEFKLLDKLQSDQYIKERAEKLRELYGANPEVTKDLISLVYPHRFSRSWTDEELREKLQIPEITKAAAYVVSQRPEIFSKVAAEFLVKAFPNIAAAIDAYRASKAQQDYLEAQKNAIRFPALHSSQPEMMYAAQHAAAGGDPSEAIAQYRMSQKMGSEDLGIVARGRTPFKPLDPAMQRLRDAQGVNLAFEDNAQIDPTNPNPEPGVIHRADA